jgi:DNA gyrase/topoisomerase IV subunit B
MNVKKTRLMAAELEMIADTLTSDHCRQILKDAATRLSDLEKIAEFYQAEASRLAKKNNRRKKTCKKHKTGGD